MRGSLQTRLTAAVVGLVALALLVAGGSVYALLADNLQERGRRGEQATDTLEDVLELELFAGAVTVVLIAAASFLLVRRALRPLRHVQHVARAVAEGDLTQRVAPTDPTTEIGRTGADLDLMLDALERAFGDSLAAQDRLRRFVADAGHELRTPLTSIRGYAEMFDRGARDDPADLALVMRRIRQESERMSVLVDDLMALARHDENAPRRVEDVDLAHVLADVVADARAGHPGRALTLEASPATVVGDPDQLRQAVGNLVRNALVHTSSTVEVALASRPGECVVAVVDHGPGIPAEHRQRVFERFSRLDASRSRDRGGSGLGLAVASALVAAHGGRLEVDDTDGGGATFRVVLPAG